MIKSIKEKTYNATQWTYTWLGRVQTIVFILYILGLLGVWHIAPSYLRIIKSAFNIIVAAILIYFFHPFKKTVCNDFHRRVVFSAGMAILFQTTLVHYINPLGIVKIQ